MVFRALCILILLAACGRPLSENELAFVARMKGGDIDTSRVRLIEGVPAGSITFKRPVRPRVTCRERILPPQEEQIVTVKPGAVALFNHVFVRRDIFFDDYMTGYPDQVSLLATMFFAHEMTHVWQWQNREKTGYHPLKAATEHAQSKDPYLFEISPDTQFLEFGYEQQASIVEEYICCRALAKDAPRTQRLHDMISQDFPVASLEDDLLGRAVTLPWKDAQIKGICN